MGTGAVSIGAAPALSNFPSGFANGVNIQGLPIVNSYTGKVFWLNNNNPTASDSNRGTFDRPYATLAGVMTAAGTAGNGRTPLAGRGDIIMVGAGHAETITSATALSVSVSGLSIVGFGTGGMRPTFTLSTANTATINVTAGQVSFTNCLFIANFAAIAALFTLTNAPDFTLANCEFRDTSSILNFVNIVQTDTTTNHAAGLSITNCDYNGLSATANTCLVNMLGSNARVYVQNNYITHAATTQAGGMQIAAGKVVTGLQWVGNVHIFTGTDSTVGELISTNQTTNSGIIANNYTTSLAATTVNLVTASSGFKFNQNYHSDVADTQGYLVPAADS